MRKRIRGSVAAGIGLVVLGLFAAGTPATAQVEPQAPPGRLVVVKHTGFCMTVRGASQANSATIEQQPCNPNARHQRWNLQSLGTVAGFRYVNVHSGLCLEITQASTVRGARVKQFTCKDGKHQNFYDSSYDKWAMLKAQHSKKCVTVYGGSMAAGAHLIQWSCDKAAHQLWDIR